MKELNINQLYREELFDELVYRKLSLTEHDEEKRKLLSLLADMEGFHASTWRDIGESRGVKLTGLGFWERVKAGLYILMRKALGVEITLKVLERAEEGDIAKYKALMQSPLFTPEERERLKPIFLDEIVHEDLLMNEEVEGVGEAIYGASDGLVEVLASVSGLSGVLSSTYYVGLGGLIVAASGTLSMTLGAYLSSKSENETLDARYRRLREQMAMDREAVKEKLIQVLQKRGVTEESSRRIASELVEDKENVEAFIKGRQQSEGSSARITAMSYIAGSVAPIFPFFLGIGTVPSLLLAYLFSGLGMGLMGYLVGIASGVNPLKKALVTSSLGLGAAVATHIIGYLASLILGVTV